MSVCEGSVNPVSKWIGDLRVRVGENETCAWGSDCPNAAVVWHAYDFGNGIGLSRDAYCATCAQWSVDGMENVTARVMRGELPPSQPHGRVVIFPIGGLDSEQYIVGEIIGRAFSLLAIPTTLIARAA